MPLPPEEFTYRRFGSDNSLVVRRDTTFGGVSVSRGKATANKPAEEPQNKNAGNRLAGQATGIA
jgi:hypothetical protein